MTICGEIFDVLHTEIHACQLFQHTHSHLAHVVEQELEVSICKVKQVLKIQSHIIAITRNGKRVCVEKGDILPSSTRKINPTHFSHQSEILLIVDCAASQNMTVQLNSTGLLEHGFTLLGLQYAHCLCYVPWLGSFTEINEKWYFRHHILVVPIRGGTCCKLCRSVTLPLLSHT